MKENVTSDKTTSNCKTVKHGDRKRASGHIKQKATITVSVGWPPCICAFVFVHDTYFHALPRAVQLDCTDLPLPERFSPFTPFLWARKKVVRIDRGWQRIPGSPEGLRHHQVGSWGSPSPLSASNAFHKRETNLTCRLTEWDKQCRV